MTPTHAILILLILLMAPCHRGISTEPSPEHLTAATRFIEAGNIIDDAATGMRTFLRPAAEQFLKDLPQDEPFFQFTDSERESLIDTYLDYGIRSAFDYWEPLIADIYAKHYSASELTQLTAFFETDTGQKFIHNRRFTFDDEGNVTKVEYTTGFSDSERSKLEEFTTSDLGKEYLRKLPKASDEIRTTIGKKVKFQIDSKELSDTMIAAMLKLRGIEPSADTHARSKNNP
jgi:hypothetical protein